MLTMSEEEINSYKEGLAAEFKQPDYTLRDQTQRLWTEISTTQFKYNRNQQNLDILHSLTKDKILAFIKDILFEQQKVLEVQVVSVKHQEEQ